MECGGLDAAREPSPGYEFADYGFNRPAPEGCMVCHGGRPQPAEHVDGKYKDPPFGELAIGCENCHAPGGLHIWERQRAAPLTAKLDRSLANPANLPRAQRRKDAASGERGAGKGAAALVPASSLKRPERPAL